MQNGSQKAQMENGLILLHERARYQVSRSGVLARSMVRHDTTNRNDETDHG